MKKRTSSLPSFVALIFFELCLRSLFLRFAYSHLPGEFKGHRKGREWSKGLGQYSSHLPYLGAIRPYGFVMLDMSHGRFQKFPTSPHQIQTSFLIFKCLAWTKTPPSFAHRVLESKVNPLTWGWDEGGDDSCYEREGPLLLMKKQVKWRLVPNVYKTWLIQEQNLSSHRCPCLWTSFSGVINHYIAFPVKKIKPFRTPNLPQAIDLSNSLLTQLS